MGAKWKGFVAGVTILANVLAIALLVVPLGLPPEVVRWLAVGVLTVDAVIEVIVFIEIGGK